MITVNLPNGQKLQFPDETSQEEMRSAIIKNFPEYDMQAVKEKMQGEGASVTQDMPLEELKKISNFPSQQQAPVQGPGRSPLEYENPEDIGRAAGGGRLLKGLVKHGPEFAAAALVPEVPVIGALSRIPALAKAFQNVPRLAKYGQSILGNALSQGGVAAAFNPGTAKESAQTAGAIAGPISGVAQLAQSAHPGVRMAGRLGLGAGSGILGGLAAKQLPGGDYSAIPAGLGAAYLGFKGGPASQFQKELKGGLAGTEYKPALEAAERLNLSYLSPAESSGSPFLGAQQGNIGRTSEGAKTLYKKGQERLDSEGQSIRGLLDTVFDKKESKDLMRSLYKESYAQKVPEGLAEKMGQNDIIKRAKSIVEGNPVFKQELKGVDKNSLEYWDLVKRGLDDMVSRTKSKASGNEARIIKNTRKDLLKELDKIGPYKEARGLAEREKVREGIEKAFNKKPMSGLNMYKVLEDKSRFEKIQKGLRDVPEAQARLNDMRLVFKNLITVPTARTASALEKTSMTKPRNDVGSMAIALKEALTAGKFDKGAVELLTNPKWSHELERLSKNATPTEKNISKFIDLLGKAGAQNMAKPTLNIDIPYNMSENEQQGAEQ